MWLSTFRGTLQTTSSDDPPSYILSFNSFFTFFSFLLHFLLLAVILVTWNTIKVSNWIVATYVTDLKGTNSSCVSPQLNLGSLAPPTMSEHTQWTTLASQTVFEIQIFYSIHWYPYLFTSEWFSDDFGEPCISKFGLYCCGQSGPIIVISQWSTLTSGSHSDYRKS